MFLCLNSHHTLHPCVVPLRPFMYAHAYSAYYTCHCGFVSKAELDLCTMKINLSKSCQRVL